MAIPSKQIGWGTEENLLWQISKQLESLTGVTYNSKKTLLNVASGDNAGSKIETFSGAFTGVPGDTFLTVDLNQVSGGIIEYYVYYPISGIASTGSYYFAGRIDGGKYIDTNPQITSGIEVIDYNQDGTLISFSTNNFSGGEDVQLAYTVKLFTLPLYNA